MDRDTAEKAKGYIFTGDREQDRHNLMYKHRINVEDATVLADNYNMKYGDMGLVKETLKKAS